uniref:YjgF-like protein n=1 Tax=Mycena chlorophos TaxID=658473 RepID=A0ABQ0M3L5_MYCCL|nr:predicted protein [Mycena chlorophos]
MQAALRTFTRTRVGLRGTMTSMQFVATSDAPKAIGPYSQAVKLGDLLFCSGCIPLDPATMEVVKGGIVEQTEQAMKNLKAVVEASGSDLSKVAKTTTEQAMQNLKAVVEASGSDLSKVAKTTVFLKSMDDFATVNGIYARVFGEHTPARSCVEVSRLPKDVLFEIECIASLK